MIFRNFEPTPELQNVVKSYHLRHFEFPRNAKIPSKPFPPRDEQYLNFYVKGHETICSISQPKPVVRGRNCLVGQSTQLIHRVVSPQFLLIQVPFFPGALFRLTGIPFNELRDKSVDLDLIFPQENREIEQKLADSKSYHEMIGVVENFLIKLHQDSQTKDLKPFDKALPLFFQANQITMVDKLAENACVSVRQLERLSLDYFGVGPKTMIRINRFTNSFILKSRNQELPWLDIALQCGYEDYQHMAKEYKSFSGFSPNQLWEADGKAPDRVLGLR
mgnify:CR=1 FL=1